MINLVTQAVGSEATNYQDASGSSFAKALSSTRLLAVYLIIPVSMLLVFADMFFFEQQYRQRCGDLLLNQPGWWPLLFGLPHIVAGSLTMLDKAYLSYYRTKLSTALLAYGLLSFAAAAGPAWLAALVTAVLGFYTIYHLLAQQTGLTMTLMGHVGRGAKSWKYLVLACGLLLYLVIYLQLNYSQISIASYNPVAFGVSGFVVLLFASVCLTVRLQRDTANAIARCYIWANLAMLLSVAIAFALGYLPLVFIIPRIVHDLTAYQIYFNHDSNRNAQNRHNLLYTLPCLKYLPFWLTLTLASVIIALLLQSYHHPLTVCLVYWLTFMHYHAEGIIWRKPNLHRRHLLLS